MPVKEYTRGTGLHNPHTVDALHGRQLCQRYFWSLLGSAALCHSRMCSVTTKALVEAVYEPVVAALCHEGVKAVMRRWDCSLERLLSSRCPGTSSHAAYLSTQ